MLITDIHEPRKFVENIQYLEIKDPKASLNDINGFLASLAKVNNLNISTPISSFPDHLDRLKVRDFTLNAKEVDFDFGDSLISENLDNITLNIDTLNHIPPSLWNKKYLNIEARSLKHQNFENAKGNPKLNCILNIKDLTFLPNVEMNSLRIKSDLLSKIESNFFKANSNSLKELKLDCISLNQMEIEGNTLQALTTFDVNSNQKLYGKDLSLLPDSIRHIVIKALEIEDLDFSRFHKVYTLYISGLFTKAIYLDSDSLTNLAISDSRNLVFNFIATPKLKRIDITSSLSRFPDFILECTALEHLSLKHNDIHSIPKDWSQLKYLTSLSLENNNIYFEDLIFLDNLKNLKRANISYNRYKDKYIFLTKRRYPILPYGFESLLKCDASRIEEIIKFAPALAKSKLDVSIKKSIFDAFIASPDLLDLITQSKENLLASFHINYRPLKLEIGSYIDEIVQKSPGISTLSGAKVFIDGKTKLSLTNIKSLLSELGASVQKTWSNDVSHILLGDKPKDIRSFNSDNVYITEGEVASSKNSEKFINVQIESGNTEIADKLKLFLLSPDGANVKIGLKMLASGGVNANVFPVLLAIAKANKDAKLRNEAKRLLELHGPQNWSSLLSNKLLFKNLNDKVREQEINKKLEKISKEIGIELACELSLALYERFEKGLRFMISRSRYPEKYAKKMYDLICLNGHLNLDSAMGFKNWKSKKPEDIIFNTYKIKLPLPIKILEYKKVESIGLHNTKFTAIPKDIIKFKDLKRIDFSCNNISKIPAYFAQLTSLDELDISLNTFEEFPMTLVKMKNLKKVNFQYNRNKGFMGDFNPITIPSEVLEQMPNCVFNI